MTPASQFVQHEGAVTGHIAGPLQELIALHLLNAAAFLLTLHDSHIRLALLLSTGNEVCAR
jgi:hypothetical protein